MLRVFLIVKERLVYLGDVSEGANICKRLVEVDYKRVQRKRSPSLASKTNHLHLVAFD